MWNPLQSRHRRRSKRDRKSIERLKSLGRQRAHERLENRLLLAGDPGPLTGIVSVRYEFVDQSQNPVTELSVGADYTLNVHVRDNRGANATSVRQAYFDITYNDVISVTGNVTHDPEYATSVAGNTSTPGLIDEAGGVDTDRFAHLNPLDSETLLFSVPIQAMSSGTLQLTGGLADESFRSVLLFDSAMAVDLANIDFICDTIEIVDSPVQVSPTDGLITTEAGGTDSFDIVLSVRPTDDVNIILAPSDSGEGSLSDSVVTFTPDNWNDPQTVTVTGVDDPQDDGDVGYTITTLATSSDSRYQNVAVDDVSVTNMDNDTVGVEVSSITGNTREDGTEAMFMVRLTSEPVAPVIIPLLSSDPGEGAVQENVQFDAQNWFTGVVVSVFGVGDNVVDSDTPYMIVTGDPTSADMKYDALVGDDVADVAVINENLDTAGVDVSLISGNTNEDGTTASFSVTLSSQPSAPVIIPLSSSDEGEGRVLETVTLDQTNWETGVTVDVTGVDDDIIDGNVPYTIVTGDPLSLDNDYNALEGSDVADVSVVNEDLDSAGVHIAPESLSTKEDGTQATFTVTLTSEPSAPVTIPLSSSDEGEGTVQSDVVLDASNWNTGVTVQVRGVADELVDDDAAYTIVTGDPTSDDMNYDALDAEDVIDLSAVNENIDTASVIVSSISGNTREDGTKATFNVSLNSQPDSPVNIPLSSSDEGEGTVPAQVVVDATNWESGVVVEVTGEDDDNVDGDIPFTIVTGDPSSDDINFDLLSASEVADVSVLNEDLDTVGINVSLISGNTREDGTVATFTVTLASQPSSPVTIPLISSDPGEGTSPESVVIDQTNWQTGALVEVSGVDDDIIDGDISYTILMGDPTSVDPNYDNLNADDVSNVSVVNEDLDVASVSVTPAALTTDEGRTTTAFTVALSSQPTEPVTIPLSSTNPGEGTVPASVVLDSTNWMGVAVEVTGINDEVVDGDVDYTIVTGDPTSSDADYDVLTAMDVEDISVTSENRHSAGVNIDPSSLTTREDGTTASFTVTLNSRPNGTVTIPISSSDESEGTLTQSEVMLDPTNWNTGITIEVTGQDDGVADGNVDYSIVTGDPVSSDADYNALTALDVEDVSMTNADDESTISVTGISGATSEDGGTATFVVSLAMEPTAPVTIPLRSSNVGEGSVQSQVVLDSDNWDTGATITVTGVDDSIIDGPVTYSIETLPATSDDLNYADVDAANVTVVNNDDDTAMLTIADFSQSEGTGGGTTIFTFDVMLSDAVAGPFTVDFVTIDGTAIAADGDYAAATQTLNFAGSANELRTIAVAVNQDAIVEADETFEIRLQNVIGISAQQIVLPTTNAVGTIANDDSATVTIVGPASTQEGTSDSDTMVDFLVQLSATVQGGFTLDYSTNDGSATIADDDYSDNDGTLAFDGTEGETQTITVAVRADDRIESDETLNVILGALTGLVTADPSDITVETGPTTATILNDDFPQLNLSEVTTSSAEGSGGSSTEFTFEVTLEGPVADGDGFEVPFAVIDGTATASSGDFIANSGSLLFTGVSGQTQTITVSVIADAVVEPHETFSVRLGEAVGLAPGQTLVIPVDTLESKILNDDVANLILTAANSNGTEGDAYEFTVTLSAEVQDSFTIDYTTVAATATETDSDYTPASGTLTFTGMENEFHSFTVQSLQDNKVELDEVFAVALQTVNGLPPTAADAIFTIGDPLSVTVQNDDSATLTISPPTAVSEGSGGTPTELLFEVSLSAPVQGGVSVNHQTVAGTAFSTSDFVAGADTLNFTDDAETKTISVLVGADDIVEADETFQVMLDQLAVHLADLEDSVTIATETATATILNDDSATLSITGPGALDEGSEFEFTVTLSNSVQDGLNVVYTTDEGTATILDNDFQDNDGLLTFTGIAGETRTILVQTTDDDRVEPDETFTVALGSISGIPVSAANDVSVANGTSNATILTNDFSRLVFSDITTSQVEGSAVGNTTEFQFTVTLTDAVNDPDGFQVPVTINDGTATVTDGDYQDNDVVLHFNGTDMETQTVSVLVNHDSIVEIDETFSIELGTIAGLAIGEQVVTETTSLTATIRDDDTATLTLSSAETLRDEGDSGTTGFVFDITLSAPVQGGFDIPFTTDDLTATLAGADYVDNDTTLNFSGIAAETQQVTVFVNADEVVEGDESFRAAIGEIGGLDSALLDRITVSDLPVTATIVNDDTATLSISGPGALNEGTGNDPTAFVFTVTLSAAVQGGLTVAYDTDEGTATLADNDFQDNDGSLMFAGTVPGTRTVIVVPVLADNKVEPDETFLVSLGAISNLPATAADDVIVDVGSAVATIESDDFAKIVLSDVTASTVEGSSAGGTTEFQFTVALTDDVNDPDGFQIPLMISDGTATESSGDYQDNDMVLEFDGIAMETKTVSVLVNHDLTVETDETFNVELGSIAGLAVGETVVLETTSLTATISDDDSATLTLSTTDASHDEGNSGTTDIIFDVILSAPVQGTFEVPFTTSDLTATVADGDYVDNDSTIIFSSSSADTVQVTIQLNGDAKVEPDEMFEVALGAISGLDTTLLERVTLNGSPVSVTIENDDTATLTITGPGSLNEGNGAGASTFNYTVTLSNPVDSPFSLPYQTIDGTANVADNDYINNDGSLSFTGDVESHTISVLVNHDLQVEGDETFQVSLGSISGLNTELANLLTVDTNPVKATILNDDVGTIAFATDSSSLLEVDGQISIPVQLDVPGGGTLSAPAIVNVFARDSSIASPSDFTLVTPTITFPTGSPDGAVQNVQLTLTQDNLTEDIETIELGLELAAGNVTNVELGSPTGHTVTVADDAMDAIISGRVWVDANVNGALDIGEKTIKSVTIDLTGTSLSGETIIRQVVTDDDGFYQFGGLPAGTYSVIQEHPTAFMDGQEILGTVGGIPTGIVSNDRFDQIQLDPSQIGRDFHFGEHGLQSSQVSRFRLLSRPMGTSLFGNPIMSVSEQPVPNHSPSDIAAASLDVTIVDALIGEDDGSAATTATVSRSNAGLSSSLDVTLASDDPSEAIVPVTVTIPANEVSASFNIDAVDEGIIDGTQTVTVTASAPGYVVGTDTVNVTDDETNISLELDPATQLVTVNDATPTVSVLWDKAVQQAVVSTSPGPTISSRAYAMMHTAMYDAWSAYDETATSTVLADDLQRPLTENSDANKTEAMSFAAYRVVDDLFATESDFFSDLMTDLGYDPANETTDPSTPAGIGNVMASALLASRHADGSNQLGDSPDGSAGVPYADVTGYSPVNTTGMTTDIERWTPESVPIDAAVGTEDHVQSFLTPHWGQVTPFSFESSDQFRPQEPEPFLLVDGTADLVAGTITLADQTIVPIERDLIGTVINPDFIDQAEHVAALSAELTDEQKLIAEFWEDGAGTSFPPGTWMTFGQFVSARDDHSLDQDAQLFFALSNAVFDAGIATWEAKAFYDYVRPVRAIRELGNLGLIGQFDTELNGFAIDAWSPGNGRQRILASDFLTYQAPSSDPSPTFSEYTSGHSAFSAAGAEILQRFTGRDDFGASVSFDPGESRFEPGQTPAAEITLQWDTFSTAADEAGISRLYGGIHFVDGDVNGRTFGRAIGQSVWAKAQFYISGGTE